jgi:lambda family phage minor tail protein L
MSIASDIQGLEPTAIVELFELDATAIGGSILRFHAGTNELKQNVVWGGVEYQRFPIKAQGFDFNANGQLPRPKIQVSNILSAVSTLLLSYSDLLGAKITRKRTLKKYLDAVNFAAGNPSADPTASFADDIFYIDRKVSENRDAVEFELTASFDLAGVQLPRRQIIQNLCAWKYKSSECGYADTNYFLKDDTPTAVASQDVCGKRVASCKKRFGAFGELPFGGFPGADLVK